MSDIQSKVLVVKPTISMPGNSRTDEELTTEIHDRERMDQKAGRYVKQLYPPEYLKPIQNVAREARRFHNERTVVSSFGSLLPTVRFEEYRERMESFIHRFNLTALEFKDLYPQIMDEARRIHNGHFKPELYPAHPNVLEMFGFTLFTAPLPRARDVMVDYLAEDRMLEIRASLEADVARAGVAAGEQIMSRVLACVHKITDRLSEPEAVFRDTLIDNLREVLEIAPALNIASSATVANLIAECRVKLLQSPETLRQSPDMRALTAEHAKNIALRFGQMGGRKLAA